MREGGRERERERERERRVCLCVLPETEPGSGSADPCRIAGPRSPRLLPCKNRRDLSARPNSSQATPSLLALDAVTSLSSLIKRLMRRVNSSNAPKCFTKSSTRLARGGSAALSPCSPASPCGPLSPGRPSDPLGPCCPSTPSLPASPCSPAAPCGPQIGRAHV